MADNNPVGTGSDDMKVVGFHDVYLRDQQRIGLQVHHEV